MLESPLVSVIIPNYNYANFIVETLDSVAEQTYHNWECIIVDDGSTDDSKAIIDEYLSQKADHRFKAFYTQNSGTSAAKNFGIDKASGVYVQFLDADDLLSPSKIESGVNSLKHSSAVLAFCKTIFFESKNGRIRYFHKYPEGYLLQESKEGYDLIEKLTINNFATINSPITRMQYVKAIQGFDSNIKQNEDWLFWFKIASINPAFIFDPSPESIVKIRVHGVSAMSNATKMFSGEKRVRLAFEPIIAQADWLSAHQKKNLTKLSKDLLALLEVRSLSASVGFRYILKSFYSAPLSNFKLLVKALFKFGVRKVKMQ